MSGPSAGSAMALHILAGTGLHGGPDGFMLLESGYVGTSAGNDRDAADTYFEGLGRHASGGIDRHRGPGILVPDARRVSAPAAWDGRRRQVPRGCRFLHGLSDRRVEGHGHHAAGQPGTGTDRRNVRRRSGSLDRVPHPSNGRGSTSSRCHQQSVPVQEGESLLFDLASGGGWGDPLDRDPRARGGRCQGRQADGCRGPRHLRCRRRGCGRDRAGEERGARRQTPSSRAGERPTQLDGELRAAAETEGVSRSTRVSCSREVSQSASGPARRWR